MAQHFDPVTLRVFIAVCEEGNIARAAEREALVASAVSKRIAAIEAEIGTPLLTRGRRGVALVQREPAQAAPWVYVAIHVGHDVTVPVAGTPRTPVYAPTIHEAPHAPYTPLR